MYETRIKQILDTTHRVAGYDIPLRKSEIGQFIIPRDLLKKDPDLQRYVNTYFVILLNIFRLGRFLYSVISRFILSVFRRLDAIEYKNLKYQFINTSYPWEIYRGSFSNLSDPYFKQSRSVLLEDVYLDDTFFDSDLSK